MLFVEYSTPIGRGPTGICSDWLDLDQSVAMPALLCHKDTDQGTQSPLLGSLGRILYGALMPSLGEPWLFVEEGGGGREK